MTAPKNPLIECLGNHSVQKGITPYHEGKPHWHERKAFLHPDIDTGHPENIARYYLNQKTFPGTQDMLPSTH